MKLNQQIKIKTATINGYEKVVHPSYDGKTQIKTFTIICCPNNYNQYYSILIEDKMLGWTINQFHVEHYHIDKKFLGKKFFDIDESYVI